MFVNSVAGTSDPSDTVWSQTNRRAEHFNLCSNSPRPSEWEIRERQMTEKKKKDEASLHPNCNWTFKQRLPCYCDISSKLWLQAETQVVS